MQKEQDSLVLSYDLLEMIGIAMNDQGFESNWCLDVDKSEVVNFVEEWDEDLPEMSADDDTEASLIPIPNRSSREGWKQMEGFIHSLDPKNLHARRILTTAIEGRGAFSRFKDRLFELGLLQLWYEHKGREDTREALEWLHSRGLIGENDLEKGMQLYEAKLAKRKHREEEVAAMQKGVTVVCRENTGHADKISIGSSYRVLAERERDLLVRIEDDRGKEVWMPKSCFEMLEGV